jgi:hypothetical protein
MGSCSPAESLNTKLLRDPEKLIFGTAKLTGEPDIFGSFFKQLSQEFAPSDKRLFAEISSF